MLSSGASRDEVAEHILALRERIQRWSARDFKRRSAPFGLTETQFAILAFVECADRLNVSTLAERLELSAPTVVRAVDALERKGLVTRARGDRDHREVTVLATAEGTRAYEQLRQARKERFLTALSTLDDGDLTALLRGYEAFANALDSDDAASRAAV